MIFKSINKKPLCEVCDCPCRDEKRMECKDFKCEKLSYYEVDEYRENLWHDSIDDAVDDAIGDDYDFPVELFCFSPVVVKTTFKLLDEFIYILDEEFKPEDCETKITEEMRKIEKEFIDKILSLYKTDAHEPICKVVIENKQDA
jgi:hypothetical protein